MVGCGLGVSDRHPLMTTAKVVIRATHRIERCMRGILPASGSTVFETRREITRSGRLASG